MKRIGIIQIWQESNSFNPVLTTRADFEALALGTGRQGLQTFAKGEEVGGFVKGLNTWQEPAEPIGLLLAQAWPGGPITAETRFFFTRSLDKHLRQAGNLDGVLVSLHGAMAAEDEADVDGLLLEKIRTNAGADTPIVASLDLHAHLTSRMCQAADALVAYHANPHIDRFQTGERAARVLERILSGAKPEPSAVRLPMLMPGEVQNTTGPVLTPVFQRVRQMESHPEVLSASVFMTNPYLDTPDLGWTILLFTDARHDLSDRLAEELARMCWERREKLTIEFMGAEESVSAALAYNGGPVVIADGADATNSGACGDSVHLLGEMLKRPVPGGALTVMVDPQAVACARDTGVGNCFHFAVGGKRDKIFSKPLTVSGKVISLQPAQYVLSGHIGDNLSVDMGNSATIKSGDVVLLLVEKTGPGSSPMMYRCVGLEPKDFKIVVVKSPAGFRAEYEPFTAGIILSACPGCASSRLAEMPYKSISRPVWPLDEISDWQAVEWTKRLKVSNKE